MNKPSDWIVEPGTPEHGMKHIPNVVEKAHAVHQAALSAGDASGNADAADYLMGRIKEGKDEEDIAKVIQYLEWAREQSSDAARLADRALQALHSN